MITIAFTFTSKDIDYVVLTGTRLIPSLKSKGKILLPTNYDIPQTVVWFETELELLINNIQPNKVVYKLTINNVKNIYVSNVYYGQGILNLICGKKGISISHISPVSIKPSKFNQPKEIKLHDYLESLIGKHSSPWDKGIKDTSLIALSSLE